MRVTFRTASEADAATLLPMMRALWEHEGIAFDEPAILAPLSSLFADPALGRVWLALADGTVAGYAMGTWGFSTEQGGRFLLLDELFVLPAFRGEGIGSAALAFVEEAARAEGAGAVAVAAALAGQAGAGKVVCVISGGNIDTGNLTKILSGDVP